MPTKLSDRAAVPAAGETRSAKNGGPVRTTLTATPSAPVSSTFTRGSTARPPMRASTSANPSSSESCDPRLVEKKVPATHSGATTQPSSASGPPEPATASASTPIAARKMPTWLCQ